jgi:RNA polymerase sigma factor (TIGR02999 family)
MGEVTKLLKEWRAGDREAEKQLLGLLYPDLRRIARSVLRRDGRDHTLQPTALVNELYLRLAATNKQDWPNRRAFFQYAAIAMRRMLIDHWRRRGNILLPLGDLPIGVSSTQGKIELAQAVHEVLNELAKDHPDWCSVVEMKFFLGLDNRATAQAMGFSLRTVERIWHDARWYLYEKLKPGTRVS